MFLPLAIVALVSLVALSSLRYFLIGRRKLMSNEALLPAQLVLFATSILALIAMIVVLPVAESTRNQILALVGVLDTWVNFRRFFNKKNDEGDTL